MCKTAITPKLKTFKNIEGEGENFKAIAGRSTNTVSVSYTNEIPRRVYA